MSGHSKWSTIKRKKGAIDQKRGALFSKLSRAITVAARSGLPDPDANAALAAAVQKAKDYSMPKDNIERAIAKAAGGTEADAYERVIYEGYGPAGVAVIVETLTDNRNRTAADVRHAFTKYGGSLGTTGCVAYRFVRTGQILLAEGSDEDEAMLAAADAGADDVIEDSGSLVVNCDPAELATVRAALESAGLSVEGSEIELVPQDTVTLEEAAARSLLNMIETLEDLDDVQSVSANFDIPEAIMESVAGG